MGLIANRWATRAHGELLNEIDFAVGLTGDPARFEAASDEVSAWRVDQHLEHLWRADRTIVTWLVGVRDGTVETDGPGATVPGRIVMWLGRIPRGRGTAPKGTIPDGVEPDELAAGFRAVRADVAGLAGALRELARSPLTRRHHLLGSYTAAEWLRFAQIHHAHHRRIIDEILASRS